MTVPRTTRLGPGGCLAPPLRRRAGATAPTHAPPLRQQPGLSCTSLRIARRSRAPLPVSRSCSQLTTRRTRSLPYRKVLPPRQAEPRGAADAPTGPTPGTGVQPAASPPRTAGCATMLPRLSVRNLRHAVAPEVERCAPHGRIPNGFLVGDPPRLPFVPQSYGMQRHACLASRRIRSTKFKREAHANRHGQQTELYNNHNSHNTHFPCSTSTSGR